MKGTVAFPTVPVNLSTDLDPLRNPVDVDDKTLDELLADLGPEDQWTLNPEDPKDIQKLLDEAKKSLPSEKHQRNEDSQNAEPSGRNDKLDKQYLTRDLDMSVFALDDEDSNKSKGKGKGRDSRLEDESREAQEIVAKLLDEVNFERANAPQKLEDSEEESDESWQKIPDDGEADLALPSAPSTLPDPISDSSRKSLDFESDIAARMAALKGISGPSNELGLPSAPKFKPADKPVKGIMKKTNYTDEEVDSWCIICQDDATVKCLGCGGDLYCAMCWKEGHMGPDVGWEEKKHKWTKYRKPN